MYSDVGIEPRQALSTGKVFTAASANTSQDDRADLRAKGFGTRSQNAFFDVRVFHPLRTRATWTTTSATSSLIMNK